MNSSKRRSTETSHREKQATWWTPGFGLRLSSVIANLGGLSATSTLIGITDEQIAKWRDGRAKAPFYAIAQMASVAEVDLNWLAFGDDFSTRCSPIIASKQHLDRALLREVILAVCRWIKAEGLSLSPEKTVALIEAVYDYMAGLEAPVSAPLDLGNLDSLMRLVLK